MGGLVNFGNEFLDDHIIICGIPPLHKKKCPDCEELIDLSDTRCGDCAMDKAIRDSEHALDSYLDSLE